MSTNLGTIEGRAEATTYGLAWPKQPVYKSSEIAFTRFHGGSNGVMLQVTIQEGDKLAYVQLTEAQVQEAIAILQNYKTLEP